MGPEISPMEREIPVNYGDFVVSMLVLGGVICYFLFRVVRSGVRPADSWWSGDPVMGGTSILVFECLLIFVGLELILQKKGPSNENKLFFLGDLDSKVYLNVYLYFWILLYTTTRKRIGRFKLNYDFP